MNDLQTLIDIAGMVKEYIEKGILVQVVRCKDCEYAIEHSSYSVFGKPLYACNHIRQIGRGGLVIHTADWFCADGEKRNEE